VHLPTDLPVPLFTTSIPQIATGLKEQLDRVNLLKITMHRMKTLLKDGPLYYRLFSLMYVLCHFSTIAINGLKCLNFAQIHFVIGIWVTVDQTTQSAPKELYTSLLPEQLEIEGCKFRLRHTTVYRLSRHKYRQKHRKERLGKF
jgi:hypothetical protein